LGGQQPGHIGTFINNGTLNVAGYANGAELRAYGVAVFNGTIEEFQNLSGGRIEVYGNNTGGNATVYGVGAFRGDGGYGNLTKFMNAGLINATAIGSNATAFGVYADDYIGNFTNTGNISVSSIGNTAYGLGVYGANIGNFTNEGIISVFGNVTGSGQLMVGGVYAVNATNVVNNGNVTVNGTGGYVNYAGNNVPAGFEIANLGNFTNTGNINVSIESVNATAVGVRSYDIGYFNNTGNISVFTNSTSGNYSAVIGVMAGKPAVFGGQQPGHIGTFINNGTLNVAGYANGAELRAYGVAVFNGTIEEFQNLSGGRIEVYGNNTGGNATVYGVGAFRGDGGYGNLTKFMNAGLINATAIGSNATAFGVYADDYIGNFTNTG
jgi:hypothetical protein